VNWLKMWTWAAVGSMNSIWRFMREILSQTPGGDAALYEQGAARGNRALALKRSDPGVLRESDPVSR
jgi:hypothetical protein